ncbi:RsmD family RNA methyltransferase [Thiothrix subterranea]|uniref:RsmD family RNA methyltransferase n=1 Tax=Thiothrix subterranea TaxID=2735563 RepID=UPI00280AFCE3|nr:RsmD family RNA methyltransferase [Thiothrix subterranea]
MTRRFAKICWKPVLDTLLAKSLLKPGGMIYLEHESDATIDFSRFNLNIHRETQAGQVKSFLLI